MHTLYITGIDDTAPGAIPSTIRGIRAAQRHMGGDGGFRDALTQATGLVVGHIGYIVVGQHDDLLVVQEAVEALNTHAGEGLLTTAIDLNEVDRASLDAEAAMRAAEGAEAPDEEKPPMETAGGKPGEKIGIDLRAGGFTPSTSAAQTALVLLAETQGNVVKAMYLAGLIGRAQQELEEYQEVQVLLAHTFPAFFGDDGPTITIFG